MMASTVKNGNDRLRRGNRQRLPALCGKINFHLPKRGIQVSSEFSAISVKKGSVRRYGKLHDSTVRNLPVAIFPSLLPTTPRAPQKNPIFSPFPSDLLIVTGYESVTFRWHTVAIIKCKLLKF